MHRHARNFAVFLSCLLGATTVRAAVIDATPNPVVIPTGASVGTTTISWNTPGYSWVNILLSVDGGAAAGFAGGGTSGAQDAGWIQPEHSYTFSAYPALPPDGRADTAHLLGSVTVNGVRPAPSTLTATPSTVVVPTGASAGFTTIAWNAPGYSWLNVLASVDGAQAVGFAGGGTSGSQGADWIQANHTYTFSLYPALPPDGRADTAHLLASATVTGVPQQAAATGTLQASPQSVIVAAGATYGSTTLAWTSTNTPQVGLTQSIDGGAETSLAPTATNGSTTLNTLQAPHDYTFRLYARGATGALGAQLAATTVNVASASNCTRLLNGGRSSDIQSALNAMPNYGTLCLARGSTYSIDTSITIPATKNLQATGSPSLAYPKLAASRALGGPILWVSNFAGHSSISGIEIVGVGLADSNPNATGIYVYQSTDVTISDVRIRNTHRASVAVLAASNVAVRASTFSEMGGDTPPVAVTCNYVSDSNGVEFSGNSCTGRGPVVQQDGDGGSSFYNSRNLQINNNTYVYGGIYLAGTTGCHTVTISGNTLTDGHEWPFDIVNGSSEVDVIGNTVRGAGWGASVLVNTSNVHFRGNTFLNNNVSGYAQCNGINDMYLDRVHSSNTGVVITKDNVVSPGPVLCPFYPL